MKHQIAKSGVLSGFVWLSSYDSRAAGKVSVMAIAETVLAVCVFWGVYLWTGFAWHLLTSVLAAPFVLFRSDAGLKLLHRLWDNRTDPAPAIERGWVAAIVLTAYAALAFAIGWGLGDALGPPPDGWGMIGRYGLAMVVAAALVIAIEFSVLQGRFREWRDQPGGAFISFGSALFGALGMAVVTQGAGLATALTLLLLPLWPLAVLTAVFVGGGAGLLVLALVLRFICAVCYLRAGLRALPQNLRRTLFLSDWAQAPELVPDIREVTPGASFEGVLEGLRNEDISLLKPFWALGLLCWAVPTFCYRFSLRSTIWLYVPILLTRIPAKLRDEAGRRDFLARQNTTIWEWLQIAIALGALAYAGWFALDWSQAGALQEVRDGATPLTPYHILLMLDFDRLAWWNAVSVPAALLTVALWVWINWVRRKGADPMGGQITALLLAMNLRNWLAYAWCAIALYSVIGDAYLLCKVPDWNGVLEGHFGAVSCPALAE